jgi:molybdenum cofactor cytidylyltransferase
MALKSSLTLAKALRLDQIPAPRVAFVGAGGKTTALFQAARELAPCIVTTTTHLGAWQADEADQHIIIEKPEDVNQLEEIAFSGVILVTGKRKEERLTSLAEEELNWLEQFCNYHSLPLLIEADGARGKPLKAPKAHEPVIPDFVDTVVVVAGLSGIGKNLDDENVYNAEGFEKLGNQKEEKSNELMNLRGSFTAEAVSPQMLANVLMHENGGLKGIPPNARKIALLNQADTPKLQAIGGKIAKELITPRSDDFSRQGVRTEVLTTRGYDAALVTSLQPSSFIIHTFEKTAAIILAAGSSSRFGKPKQLLDYHGKPFVRVVAEVALQAELDPIVVVTGTEHDKISTALADLPVNVVQNPNWADGQSSSIQVGVENLAPSVLSDISPKFSEFRGEIGSAFFLLADQPHVTPTVIRALVEEHARTLHPVIAPMVEDRRANPVLFDRVTFPALMALEGDIGGRGIFSKFSPKYVHWNDSRLLLDVDTPDAYKKLIER